MRRIGPATESALSTLALIVGVAVVLSVLNIVPSTSAPATIDQAAAPTGTVGSSTNTQLPNTRAVVKNGKVKAAASGGSSQSTAVTPASGTVPAAQPGLACSAGQNGGATDTGVSATTIKLAATTVTDGPGASFLAPMNTAMQAVVNKVNRAGGICGRQLDLQLANDSWQESLGENYIKNFVQGDHVFALAVNPDSEGLYGAAVSGYIARERVPVVGTGGQVDAEYDNPWIWPVGTATTSQMHIMAKDAYTRGARNFAIVFDAKYHFGVEGAYAFDQAVKRLTGHDIPGYDKSLQRCSQRFCGIQPGQSSYASLATQFNNSCYQGQRMNTACDFIAYLLEPDLALSWLSNIPPAAPAYGAAGAQPLFDRQAFAEQCHTACAFETGFDVWTGYQPPEGSYAGQPAEAAYVNLLRSYDGSADVDNQFVEGAYIGMNLLVSALTTVGPDLTRTRLQAVLDAMTYRNGLSRPLGFKPGDHYANTSAMSWRLKYSNGSFSGFAPDSGFQSDPWVGQDSLAGH